MAAYRRRDCAGFSFGGHSVFPMHFPSRTEAQTLLHSHVQDEYQRYHALMVATAMEGYAIQFNEPGDLWFVTGYLHDIDFDQHPDTHPAESLRWFAEWDFTPELIHAVKAHAYGYNGYTTLPQTRLAASLLACDEISGIFYAYRKMNPVGYGEMKGSSIRKKVKDLGFAAKIDRASISTGCEHLGVSLEDHIANLIKFFAVLK